jgi:hypothetical protein
MNVVPLLPREQTALLADLKSHDESWAWELVSLYPTAIDALDPEEVKSIAVKMAMMLSCFAIDSGRRDRNTDALINHIMLDLMPLQNARLILHSNVST